MSQKSPNIKLPKIEEVAEEEEALAPKVGALTKLYRALWAVSFDAFLNL
jgi:hypothetical protein